MSQGLRWWWRTLLFLEIVCVWMSLTGHTVLYGLSGEMEPHALLFRQATVVATMVGYAVLANRVWSKPMSVVVSMAIIFLNTPFWISPGELMVTIISCLGLLGLVTLLLLSGWPKVGRPQKALLYAVLLVLSVVLWSPQVLAAIVVADLIEYLYARLVQDSKTEWGGASPGESTGVGVAGVPIAQIVLLAIFVVSALPGERYLNRMILIPAQKRGIAFVALLQPTWPSSADQKASQDERQAQERVQLRLKLTEGSAALASRSIVSLSFLLTNVGPVRVETSQIEGFYLATEERHSKAALQPNRESLVLEPGDQVEISLFLRTPLEAERLTLVARLKLKSGELVSVPIDNGDQLRTRARLAPVGSWVETE